MKLLNDIKLPAEIFGHRLNQTLVWEVIRAYLCNNIQGKTSTKTRAELSGGGRKPWRQKGTGRSRQGSIRSPLWRGGGVVFGPKPRKFQIKVPKKKKRLALLQSLSYLHQMNRIKVVDDLSPLEPKTRLLFDFIKSVDLDKEKVLIITERYDRNLTIAARNIPTITVALISNLNPYLILRHQHLIFTEKALKIGINNWLKEKDGD